MLLRTIARFGGCRGCDDFRFHKNICQIVVVLILDVCIRLIRFRVAGAVAVAVFYILVHQHIGRLLFVAFFIRYSHVWWRYGGRFALMHLHGVHRLKMAWIRISGYVNNGNSRIYTLDGVLLLLLLLLCRRWLLFQLLLAWLMLLLLQISWR